MWQSYVQGHPGVFANSVQSPNILTKFEATEPGLSMGAPHLAEMWEICRTPATTPTHDDSY